MTNRATFVLLALAACLVFTACGGNAGSGSSTVCDPTVDNERCNDSKTREVCLAGGTSWTQLEICGDGYACAEVSPAGITTCQNELIQSCTDSAQCMEGNCIGGFCVPFHCFDGVMSQNETGIDCGGVCPTGCELGGLCNLNTDCLSQCCSDSFLCEEDADADGTCDSDDACPGEDDFFYNEGFSCGCFDLDGDGYPGATIDCPMGLDCADDNASFYPGAPELCGDGINQACSVFGPDMGCGCDVDGDGDGFKVKSAECPDGTDCDDTDASVKPTSAEIPGDGIDNNCDDQIDNTACLPACSGKACGDNGCGGSCGQCQSGTICFAGMCEPEAEASGDTCLDKCGAPYDPNSSCQCDDNCGNSGDCCEDFCDKCAALYPQACE